MVVHAYNSSAGEARGGNQKFKVIHHLWLLSDFEATLTNGLSQNKGKKVSRNGIKQGGC